MAIEDSLQFDSDHILLLAGGCIILIIKMLFDINPNFEQLFDYMQMYLISNKIRGIKIVFQSWDERWKQAKWLIECGNLVWRLHIWRQRQIFLRETVIEYATQGKLKEIGDLDNCGPRDWQYKLLNEAYEAWALTNAWHELYRYKPSGPTIRQYDTANSRIYKVLLSNPTKHLSQRYLVEACTARGGCCARACQCCMNPRGLYPDKRIYYAHCTLFCGCCVRSRGFVGHEKQGKDIKGFTNFTTTPFPIEGPEGFKVL